MSERLERALRRINAASVEQMAHEQLTCAADVLHRGINDIHDVYQSIAADPDATRADAERYVNHIATIRGRVDALYQLGLQLHRRLPSAASRTPTEVA
jgi:hypothetical protein